MKQNWPQVRLGDIVTTNSSSYSEKEGWSFVNYLDTGNITENRIDDIQKIDLKTEKLPSRAKRKVKQGDIIYSTVRPIQKHYGIIKEFPEHFLVSTGFTTISVSPTTDSNFIYYFLIQNEIIDHLQTLGEQTVSTYPAIKASDIEDLVISLPPLPTQRAIAATLSCLDDKIELNNQTNTNLEAQAQAIFKSWFVDFEPFQGGKFVDSELGKIPEGWRVGKISEIADYRNGLAMQKYRPNQGENGLPVLKIKELRQGICDSSSEICSENVDDIYVIEDGDVIFSWSGSLLVDLWCGGKCGLNQHLFKVTSSKHEKWFYYFWTKHHLDSFISIAEDKATTMGHIKREHLEKALVLIPDEMKYREISDLLNPIINSIITSRVQSRNLAAIRDALLPKLVSGEIEVGEEI